jgi:glutamine synthetase
VAPYDHYVDLRDEMATNLQNAGFILERGHHEVGTAGQAEINYKFNTLLHAADDVLLFKYIVKNTAWAAGKTVTFMPKPLFGDNGSGMHVHQSIWNNGEPLFYDEAGYGGLSDLARYYIGGILKHAPSLLAFTNPSVNSYHRLVPGFEAPIALVYSARNRSACVRIPITGASKPGTRRLYEFVPELVNALMARACLKMPPMYHSAICDSPP